MDSRGPSDAQKRESARIRKRRESKVQRGRVPVNCVSDLTWYWGIGAESWASEAGLKSSFGAQLQRVAEGVAFAVDMGLGVMESRAIDRCRAAARATDIETRLRALDGRAGLVLHAHITGHGLPFGISSAAVFTDEARRMCSTRVAPREDVLREALMVLRLPGQESVVRLINESEALVKAAVRAYEDTVIERTWEIPIGKEEKDT